MTKESMLQHLRLRGEETIRRLRREAEAKIREQRAEAERQLAHRREKATAEFSTRLDLLSRTGLMEARRHADHIRILTRDQLAARLKVLAFENLGTLRNEDYDAVFTLLVRELPDEEWKAVTVHPDDVSLAAAALPKAAISTDSRITGGLEATGREGRVRLINTFEKRLERAWPELLPALIKEVEGDRFAL